MKYQMINPRKRSRSQSHPLTFDLNYKNVDEFKKANQKSLQRQGTVLFGPDRFNVGEELLFNLNFTDATEPVQIRGRVVWVKEYADNDSDDTPTYGMGIRYDLPKGLAEDSASNDSNESC